MKLNLIKIVLRFELLFLSFNLMLNRTFLWNHAKQNDTKTRKSKRNDDSDLWNHAKQNDTKTSASRNKT